MSLPEYMKKKNLFMYKGFITIIKENTFPPPPLPPLKKRIVPWINTRKSIYTNNIIYIIHLKYNNNNKN